jgi:hypothetical protein
MMSRIEKTYGIRRFAAGERDKKTIIWKICIYTRICIAMSPSTCREIPRVQGLRHLMNYTNIYQLTILY